MQKKSYFIERPKPRKIGRTCRVCSCLQFIAITAVRHQSILPCQGSSMGRFDLILFVHWPAVLLLSLIINFRFNYLIGKQWLLLQPISKEISLMMYFHLFFLPFSLDFLKFSSYLFRSHMLYLIPAYIFLLKEWKSLKSKKWRDPLVPCSLGPHLSTINLLEKLFNQSLRMVCIPMDWYK